MKIAVLFGGLSTERAVSLTGGKAIIDALREKGHEVKGIDPIYGCDLDKGELQLQDTSLAPDAQALVNISERKYVECISDDYFQGIDICFNLLHGYLGEDGKVQAILELNKIPYTGSDSLSSGMAMDKTLSKQIMAANNVLVPEGLVLAPQHADDHDLLKQIKNHFGKNLVIKPNDQGSTIGITFINDGNIEDISNGIRNAAKYSNIIILEKFIEGRELTVGIVGNQVLPVIEIKPDGGYYDYEHKYTKGKSNYVCPAELPQDIAEFTQNMAEAAYTSLKCSGFGRVDFRLNTDGQPIALEVNTVPGFTSTSLVPMAAQALGISFADLCEQICNLGINKWKK